MVNNKSVCLILITGIIIVGLGRSGMQLPVAQSAKKITHPIVLKTPETAESNELPLYYSSGADLTAIGTLPWMGVYNFDKDSWGEIVLYRSDTQSLRIFDIQSSMFILDMIVQPTFQYEEIDCADVTGDGIAEIIICEKATRIIVLNANGQVLWGNTTEQPNPYTNGLIFVDVNVDGILDVVQTGGTGKLNCYSGNNGTLLMSPSIYYSLGVTGEFSQESGTEFALFSGSQGASYYQNTSKIYNYDLKFTTGSYMSILTPTNGRFTNDSVDDILYGFGTSFDSGTTWISKVMIFRNDLGVAYWNNSFNERFLDMTISNNFCGIPHVWLTNQSSWLYEYDDFSTNFSLPSRITYVSGYLMETSYGNVSSNQDVLFCKTLNTFCLYDVKTHNFFQNITGTGLAADINNDGWMDVIVLNQNKIQIYGKINETRPSHIFNGAATLNINDTWVVNWTISDPDSTTGKYTLSCNGTAVQGHENGIWTNNTLLSTTVNTTKAGHLYYNLWYSDQLWSGSASIHIEIRGENITANETDTIDGFSLGFSLSIGLCTIILIELQITEKKRMKFR